MFFEWLVDVWSAQVREIQVAIEGAGYIAGGAARQIVLGEQAPPAQDIDVFLERAEAYGSVCKAIQELGYIFEAESDNAALFVPPNDLRDELPVQVIRPYQDEHSLTFGPVREVLSRFSFTTEMFGLAGQTAVFTEAAMVDTKETRLVINNVTDPLQLAMRALKYAGKGYYFDQAEMHRLFVEWEKRPQAWRAEVALAHAS